MNIVIETITGRIHDQKARFVFPSETASSLWARKICCLPGIRSVASNRFLAWDRFKEEVIRAEVQDKRPVSSVIRSLFTGALIRKNAEAAARNTAEDEGFPFRALIPPEFAGGGAVFSASIAGMLPSLSLWENRRNPSSADDEDRDMVLLKREYAEFLDRSDLFEPAWERPPLRDRDHDYYIFFYEAMEDFAEFEAILKPEKTITLIKTPSPDPAPLYLYPDSKAEIRAAALRIRTLHEERGIPFEEMAVSVPGLENMEPCLLREFSLYNIPCRSRSGKSLSEYGTGKLFSLINDCVVNDFSFDSVKALLLNGHLPWRRPDLNRRLVEFGIANNCVSAYRENGVVKDIWLEAFGNNGEEKKLRGYYEALKRSLVSIHGAKSFSEIRKRYFAFRGASWAKNADKTPDTDGRPRGFLSPEMITEEGNAVLARCIEELSSLIHLEDEFKELIPPSPFGFFLSVLKEKRYVPQRYGGGVSIFPYRVAAASPFTCHFILNASQDAASVQYQPLRFLRRDKRRRLGFIDTDVSDIFFRLYRPEESAEYHPEIWVSAAEETFSGWAIPHSYFADNTAEEPPETPPDPFLMERDWWAAGPQDGAAYPFPKRLFPSSGTALCAGGAASAGTIPSNFFPILSPQTETPRGLCAAR
jgi:hypothetical protein